MYTQEQSLPTVCNQRQKAMEAAYLENQQLHDSSLEEASISKTNQVIHLNDLHTENAETGKNSGNKRTPVYTS